MEWHMGLGLDRESNRWVTSRRERWWTVRDERQQEARDRAYARKDARHVARAMRQDGIEETPEATARIVAEAMTLVRRAMAARGFPEIAALPTRDFVRFLLAARETARNR